MNHIYKNIKGTIILDVPFARKSILDDIINALDGFAPGLVIDSANWRCWIAVLDLYTCKYCRDTHGKVFGMSRYSGACEFYRRSYAGSRSEV